MPDHRHILGFVVRFGLLFGLLTAPRPGLHAGYRWAFRSGTAFALSAAWPGSRVTVEPASDPDHATLDTKVIVVDPKAPQFEGAVPAKIIMLDSRALGWIPNAMMLALLGATPVPWAQRRKGLVIGLASVNAFVIAVVFTVVMNAIGSQEVSGLGWALLAGADRMLSQSLLSTFVFPTLVWVCWLLPTVRPGASRLAVSPPTGRRRSAPLRPRRSASPAGHRRGEAPRGRIAPAQL
jgi:hypothetical protein